MRSTKNITVFLLLAGLVPAVPGAVLAQDAEQLAREGRELIEANCGDCFEGGRAGLEEGIAKLAEALELGLDEPAAGYRDLAGAWSSLAFVYAEPDSVEQKEIFARRQQAWGHYIDLVPDDAEALYEYAVTLDGDERIAILERLLELVPEHPEALFAIGQHQVEHERVDEGLEKMHHVFERAEGQRALYYGRRLRWALDAHGRQTEGKEVARKLRQIERGVKPQGDRR